MLPGLTAWVSSAIKCCPTEQKLLIFFLIHVTFLDILVIETSENLNIFLQCEAHQSIMYFKSVIADENMLLISPVLCDHAEANVR